MASPAHVTTYWITAAQIREVGWLGVLQLVPGPAAGASEVGEGWGVGVGNGWGAACSFILRHRTLLSVVFFVVACFACRRATRNAPARCGPLSPAPTRCACAACPSALPCPPACCCSCTPSTLVSAPAVSYASYRCSSASACCPAAVFSLVPPAPPLRQLQV